MKRFFVDKKLNNVDRVTIEGVEHNHIKNVMRLSIGDRIILVCGDEFDYQCEIIAMSKGSTDVRILSKEVNVYNSNANVAVFQALVKSDNMSLIIQKLTELGIRDFYPFESEFITAKDKFGKVNKWQEISNQSIKQCKRSIPMTIHDVLSFDSMLSVLADFDIIVFANECEKQDKLSDLAFTHNSRVAIVIGSEGGFSEHEIARLNEIGAKSVTLGKRILRAETASIGLSSVVMYLMGEWENE